MILVERVMRTWCRQGAKCYSGEFYVEVGWPSRAHTQKYFHRAAAAVLWDVDCCGIMRHSAAHAPPDKTIQVAQQMRRFLRFRRALPQHPEL
jgi:hypothetical protein